MAQTTHARLILCLIMHAIVVANDSEMDRIPIFPILFAFFYKTIFPQLTSPNGMFIALGLLQEFGLVKFGSFESYNSARTKCVSERKLFKSTPFYSCSNLRLRWRSKKTLYHSETRSSNV